jgi:RecA-family ATPase
MSIARAAKGHRNNGTSKVLCEPDPLDDHSAARLVVRVARTRQAPDKAEFARLAPEWAEAAGLAEESGDKGLDDWLRYVAIRYRSDPPKAEAFRLALEAARAESSVLPPPGATQEKALFRPLTPSQLYDAHPAMREVIVDGLLRRGEIMNLVAPPKVGKSWLSLSLLFSIAVGRPWLGRFFVRKGRVLLIDNELHPETIASRMRWVAESMGLTIEDYEGGLEILPLRGRLRDLASMGEYFESIAGRFDLVVLDSGYRFTAPGDDENSNSATTARYNLLDQYADSCGAGIVYIHHASKGSQEGKATTDVGAGAGAQSRAVDTHLVLKADPTLGPGSLLVDAAIRSFAPIESFVIRREGPLWIADEAAPPPKERQLVERERREAEKARAVEARQAQQLQAEAEKVYGAMVSFGQPETLSNISARAKLNHLKTKAAMFDLIDAGRAREATAKVRNRNGTRDVAGFESIPVGGPRIAQGTFLDSNPDNPD